MSISQQNSRLPPNLRGREMRSEISSLILLNERANLLKIIKDRDNNINKRKELQDEHEEILKRLMGNIKQKKVARAKGRGGIRKSRAQEKRETERGIRGEKRTPGTDEPVIIGEQIKRTDGGLQITYQDPAESARIQRERAQDLARLENIRLEDNRLRGEREREDRNLRREELQFNRDRLERDERRHQDLLQLRDRELLAKTTSIQSNPIVPDEDIPLEKTQSELDRIATVESQLSRAGELLEPSLPPQTSATSLATSGNAPQAESIIAPSVVGDPALTVEETPETTPEDRRQEFLNLQPGGGSVFGGEELPAVGEEEAELTVEITDQPTDAEQEELFREAERSRAAAAKEFELNEKVADVTTTKPITSEELSSGIRRPPSPRQPATGRDYEDDLRLLGRAGLPIGEPGSAELLGNVDATKELADQSIERKLKTIEANAAMTSGPDDSLEKQKKANAEYIKTQEEEEREERARIAQEEGKRLIETRKKFTPPPPLPTQPGLTLNLSGDSSSSLTSIKSREPPAPRPRSKLPDELAEGLGITTSRLDPTRSSGESRGRRGGISVDKLEGITLGESIEPEVAESEVPIEPEVEEAEVEEAEVAEPDEEESGKKLSRREKIPDLLERLNTAVKIRERVQDGWVGQKQLLKAIRDFRKSKLAQETDDSSSQQKLADYLEDADVGQYDTDFEKVIEVILKGHKKDWDDKKKFNAFYDRINNILDLAEEDEPNLIPITSSGSSGSSSEEFEIEAYDAGDDVLIIDLFPQFNKEDVETALSLVAINGYEPLFVDPNQFGIMDTPEEIPFVVKYNEDGKAEIWTTNMKPGENYVSPSRFRKIGNVLNNPDDPEDLILVDDNRKRILSLALVSSLQSSESDLSQKRITVNDVEYFIDDTTEPNVLIDINTGERLFEITDELEQQLEAVEPGGVLPSSRFSLRPIPVEEPSVEEPSVEDDLGSPLSPDTLRDLAKGAPQPPEVVEKSPEVAKKSPAYRYVDRDVESPPVKKKSKPIPPTIGVKGGVQRSTSGGSMIGPRADGTKGGYTDGNIIKLLELKDDIKLSKSKKKEMKDRIKKLRQEDSLMSVTEAIDELRKLL